MIEQPKNVATPFTTVLLSPLVHDSVPPAGFVAIERVTMVELSPVTMALSAFSTATTGCCAQTTATAPPPGCVVNTRCWVPELPGPTVPGLPRFVPRQSATVCVIVVPTTWVEEPAAMVNVCWPLARVVAAERARESAVSENVAFAFRPPVGAKPHGELTLTTTPAVAPAPRTSGPFRSPSPWAR